MKLIDIISSYGISKSTLERYLKKLQIPYSSVRPYSDEEVKAILAYRDELTIKKKSQTEKLNQENDREIDEAQKTLADLINQISAARETLARISSLITETTELKQLQEIRDKLTTEIDELSGKIIEATEHLKLLLEKQKIVIDQTQKLNEEYDLKVEYVMSKCGRYEERKVVPIRGSKQRESQGFVNGLSIHSSIYV